MKRPLVYITVGYITGIIWGLYLKTSIALYIFLFGGIYFVIYKINSIKIQSMINKIKTKGNVKSYIFYIMLFIIFAIISNTQIIYLENKHNNLYKGISEVRVVGTIITDKEESTYKAKYIIKIENINQDTKYKNTNLILYTQKNVNLEYGDTVCLTGIYEEAQGATNYKAFDYKEYLKQENIYGIVNSKNIEVIKKESLNSIFLTFHDIRSKIKENLKTILRRRS